MKIKDIEVIEHGSGRHASLQVVITAEANSQDREVLQTRFLFNEFEARHGLGFQGTHEEFQKYNEKYMKSICSNLSADIEDAPKEVQEKYQRALDAMDNVGEFTPMVTWHRDPELQASAEAQHLISTVWEDSPVYFYQQAEEEGVYVWQNWVTDNVVTRTILNVIEAQFLNKELTDDHGTLAYELALHLRALDLYWD